MFIHIFRFFNGCSISILNMPIEVISRALGHKSIKTTQRYSNMKDEMAKVGTDAFLELLKK